MPCDESDNIVEFTNCLTEMSAIVEDNNVEAVFMLGDYNAHPGRPFWEELCNVCADRSWTCADVVTLGLDSDNFTYISDMNHSRRWLDHCVVTEAALKIITDVGIGHDVYWSDHFPLFIDCNLNVLPKKFIPTEARCNKVLWCNRNNDQINRYHDLCNSKLRDIDFPEMFAECAGKICRDPDHRRGLDALHDRIVGIMSESAEQTYEGRLVKRKKCVAGWNKHVREAHGEARLKFEVWLLHNKPKSGRVWDEMRTSQKVFKGRLKWCQNHQDQIKMDILASHRAAKDFGKFWTATNKLNVRPSLPVSVSGCETPEDIAGLFKQHFRVPSPLGASQRSVSHEDLDGTELLRFSGKEISQDTSEVSYFAAIHNKI
ncbi:hypothetical protein NE865_06009 [Phthorimaea operculella]|nr:hypothetical protein NE865_06009 [Phthorimaea operculella]